MQKRVPDKIIPIPRENPFRAISRMFKTSIGRLPAHLVILFFIALSCAVLCGVLLQFSGGGHDRNAYLVKRVEAEPDKASLAEEALRGVWVHEGEGYVTTLKIGNGVFELISRYGLKASSRYFIRGGYKSEGDLLILQSRTDLGTPLDINHFEYKFYPLRFFDINLYAVIEGRTMVWRTPNREKNRLETPEDVVVDIFGPQTSWMKIANVP